MIKTKRKKASQVLVHRAPGRSSSSRPSFSATCGLSPAFMQSLAQQPCQRGTGELHQGRRMCPCEQDGGQQVASSSFKSPRCDILADVEISFIFFLIAALDILQPARCIYPGPDSPADGPSPHNGGILRGSRT